MITAALLTLARAWHMHSLQRRAGSFLLAASLFASAPVVVPAQLQQSLATAELRVGRLSFLGHATVGDFIGVTSTATGAFRGDIPSARGWVEARVATLVTGNDRRDRDLRASMEVDRYPTMRFDLLGTTVSSVDARGDTLAVLHGSLAIHGVTRTVDLPATISYIADTIHVTTVFPLDLADYHIGGLTKMFGLLRMQRQIEVRVDLRFVRSAPDTARQND